MLALVAVLTSLIGFGLDFIIVPSQSCMQERSPASVRGRVLALYQALFNGGSIPVVLGLGMLTDLLGIVIVIYLLGAVSLGGAIGTILWIHSRRYRQHGHTPPPVSGHDEPEHTTALDTHERAGHAR